MKSPLPVAFGPGADGLPALDPAAGGGAVACAVPIGWPAAGFPTGAVFCPGLMEGDCALAAPGAALGRGADAGVAPVGADGSTDGEAASGAVSAVVAVRAGLSFVAAVAAVAAAPVVVSS